MNKAQRNNINMEFDMYSATATFRRRVTAFIDRSDSAGNTEKARHESTRNGVAEFSREYRCIIR